MRGFTDGTGAGPGYGGSAGGDVIGAAIQTGGAIYEGVQNRKVARENTNKTIAANKSEAELAYQRAVQERDYMNWYNSPEEQMKRFKEGGLNPHLIYGQGSGGNQASAPQYSPPNIQYKYESGHLGQALGDFIPMLMSVGTWMQNMRAQEASIKKTEVDTTRSVTDTDRVRQLMDYLSEANPKLLETLQSKVYQSEHDTITKGLISEKTRAALMEIGADMRMKYGDDFWRSTGLPGSDAPISGTAKLKYLQEHAATKLKQAQASWSEFDITNPQQIMMMVLQGIMGMAGAQMRLPSRSSAGKAKPTKGQSKAKAGRAFDQGTRKLQKGHFDMDSKEYFEKVLKPRKR